jgi:AGZA family xanthine/uracil permease-like MFS transporter
MVNRSPKAAPRHAPAAATRQRGRGLDGFFEISRRGSTIGREVRGGLVTFFTMAYIIALNPLIIGTAPDGAGNLISGQPYLDSAGQVIGANVGASITLVAVATALIAGVMTILMGVVGRFPLALATGLGLNALVAYVVAPLMTWPQAMGLIVLEGIVIFILVLTGFRTAVFKAVPRSLRTGISVGIGLFIAFVGLVDGGIVRRPASPTAPPVELGINGSLTGWPILVFVVGLLAVAILYARKVKGAILISIVGATVVAVIIELIAKIGPKTADHPTGWLLNVPTTSTFFDLPDLSLIGNVSVFGAFQAGASGAGPGVLMLVLLVFSLMLADFFDTMGTVVAVGAEGHLLDERGNPPHMTGILLVDSAAAVAGGVGSVSSNTSYIESAAGVGEGARTGLASVVTGALFLVAMFLAPVVNVIPSEAATPALVFVGFLMMSQVTKVAWDDVEEALPAFLTMALMPFTFSITVGMGAGFITYVLLKVARGKVRQVHPLLWVVSVAFAVYFVQGLIAQLLG